MVLAVQSDASYLSERNARSRAGGYFYMSNNNDNPTMNGAILTVSQIIKAVISLGFRCLGLMSSAAEAEIGALFIMAKIAVVARQALVDMGHPQPPTPTMTDNSTNSIWSTNKQNNAKSNKSNGHEIPLATRSGMPAAIQMVMEKRIDSTLAATTH
ncbi:hypothetical protein THAOC_08045 [Thalassiosira oceanica]|uniref:Uncharacterized protein n=1 Tax=Thalassiosira oceanica TaxID=159749 RepID=K0TJ29_THAOC|nr:hypothetical protein THAOC_08045 [Thalassiosira oceanica]|eukprot:EJK70582.1 hypothetical protein THAOC_08045 [Thalassiosira oceanica]